MAVRGARLAGLVRHLDGRRAGLLAVQLLGDLPHGKRPDGLVLLVVPGRGHPDRPQDDPCGHHLCPADHGFPSLEFRENPGATRPVYRLDIAHRRDSAELVSLTTSPRTVWSAEVRAEIPSFIGSRA